MLWLVGSEGVGTRQCRDGPSRADSKYAYQRVVMQTTLPHAPPSADRESNPLCEERAIGIVELQKSVCGRPHRAIVEVRRLLEPEGAVARLELAGRLEEAQHLAVPAPGGHAVIRTRNELRGDLADQAVESLCDGAIDVRQLLERGLQIGLALGTHLFGCLLGAGSRRLLLSGGGLHGIALFGGEVLLVLSHGGSSRLCVDFSVGRVQAPRLLDS